MAVETDLTTTLRITPQVDKMAVDALADQIAGAVSQRVGSAVGGAAVGGPRAAAGAGSTTVSTAQQAAPAGAPIGSSSTTSTAAGGGSGYGGPPSGGAPPAPGAPPPPSGPLPRGLQGQPLPTDYARYISGGRSETATLLSAMYQGRLPQAAIGLGTSAFSDSLMQTARAKAEMIDAMRQSGTPEDMLPTMGALRFAGPIGAAATVLGQFAARDIDQGLSLQERTSATFGRAAPTIARGYSIGVIGSGEGYAQYLQRAALARNGALDREEANEAINTLGQAGFRGAYAGMDPLRLAMTGASLSSIANLVGTGVYGGRVGQRDVESLIGTAQAGGLSGAGIDQLLNQIAANTRTLAQKGIRVDQSDLRKILDRANAAGVPIEAAAEGAMNAAQAVGSLRDQALSPFKAYGDALVQMSALRGARSYEDYVGNLEGLAEGGSRLGEVLRPGGRLVGAAYYRTGLRNALNVLPSAANEGNARPFYYGENAQDQIGEAYGFRAQTSLTDIMPMFFRQSLRAYQGQQEIRRGTEANQMNWDFINELKASLVEGIQTGQAQLITSMEQLTRALEMSNRARN